MGGMSDRPTTPDPERPDSPAQPPTAGGPDETSVLPPATAPASAPPPGGATPPPYAGPGWSAAPAASAPARTPSGPGRWWGEATSTGGGRAALVLAAVLGALLLVTGVGLTAAFVASHHPWRGDDGVSVSGRPGGGPMMGNGNGRGQGRNQGKDRGYPQQDDGEAVPAPGQPPGRMGPQGQGMGMGLGAAGLAGILHGEYTTNATGTPTVMVVQLGQVTAYTPGTSLSVKSSDGFAATYTVDGTVAVMPAGSQVATGSQVRVLAAKDGMKLTRLVVVG